MKGFVYFITNPSLRKGLYKIGQTEDVYKRMNDFNHETSCPTEWQIIATVETEKYKELERHLHHVYAAQRVNPRREFFEFEGDDALEDVLDMLEESAGLVNGIYKNDYGYDTDTEVSESGRKEKRFTMKQANIPVGDEICFKHPSLTETFKFYVAANQRHVVSDPSLVNDKTAWQTLSTVSNELLKTPGVWSSHPENWYWGEKSFAELKTHNLLS